MQEKLKIRTTIWFLLAIWFLSSIQYVENYALFFPSGSNEDFFKTFSFRIEWSELTMDCIQGEDIIFLHLAFLLMFVCKDTKR